MNDLNTFVNIVFLGHFLLESSSGCLSNLIIILESIKYLAKVLLSFYLNSFGIVAFILSKYLVVYFMKSYPIINY